MNRRCHIIFYMMISGFFGTLKSCAFGEFLKIYLINLEDIFN